uniref:DUF4336 domain-containing protein n=1 Tax=Palpitomonas bilix TaxID=652834 RepID=A0A7S3DAW9_9EUKA
MEGVTLSSSMEKEGEMVEFAPNVYLFGGRIVPFMKFFPYNTRMTVIKLADGSLFVHSPIKLTPDIKEKVDQLGTVKYLVSPNKIHHLFLSDWKAAYPEALTYASPGLEKKRKDIVFDRFFPLPSSVCVEDEHRKGGIVNVGGPHPNVEGWSDEISSHVLGGNSFMDEVLFFHRPSQTLIVADLVENFPKGFIREYWGKGLVLMAKLWGIVAPKGKAPLEWRLSWVGKKKITRKTYALVVDEWQPIKLVMAHGLCVEEGATPFLKHSFGWMK